MEKVGLHLCCSRYSQLAIQKKNIFKSNVYVACLQSQDTLLISKQLHHYMRPWPDLLSDRVLHASTDQIQKIGV